MKPQEMTGRAQVTQMWDPDVTQALQTPGPVVSPAPHTPSASDLSLCASSVSFTGPSVTAYPSHDGVYRILFRVPVSSRPTPERLNLKLADALDFGDSVTFCSRVHTVNVCF